MYKWMTAYIEIGNYVFNFVNEVEINSSWKTLTDTATIKLPNLQGALEKVLKVGDPVLIRLGYNGELQDAFTGFVSSILPKTPVEIVCEDAMWQFKQTEITKSWRSTTLKDVLQFLAPDAVISCPDITLAPFRLDRVSKAKAFEQIKSEYGLCIYFKNRSLYAGLPYATEPEAGTVFYHLQKNVPMESAKDLQFKSKEDVKIKLKAISFLPNNTKEETELGDTEGEIHTLHFYNLTLPQLKQQAQEKLDRMKYDGYRGTFIAFGEPLVQHTMVAELQDDKYPERSGKYFIDSVRTTYYSTGFRNQIELGKLAA